MKILYASIFVLLSISSFATAPTIPTSNLHFPAVDGGYFNVGWTAGNGTRRVLVCKAGSPVTFIPQNGTDYTENTNFGSGQQVAPGEFVIYDNAFTSFYLTGLDPATQYFFAAFEYNGTGTNTEYLISSYLTGSATTSSTPTTQVSSVNFTTITTNSVTLSWTNGNGQRRLIVVRQVEPVTADPVNSQPYAVNSVFGSGATIGAGNYTVYNSSSNNTVVTNLQPGTQYFFSFYEFNGSSQPQYKTPAYTTSVTTRSIPTVPSSAVVITKTDGRELSLSWTNGNGQRRIIVAKQGSNITSIPSNGTDYNANPVFGTGPQLGTGEYVVYDDNFNAATITGLNPATVYYFKIFEYDGTGTNTIYLTSLFGSINASTAVTPTVQTSSVAVSNITASSLSLQFTPGNGRARIVIARKNSPVNITPADLTAYALNANLGNGNVVVNNTTDPFAAIQNLEGNTVYHFAIFEFNGYNQPLYLSPAVIFSAPTLAALPVKLIKWEASAENGKVRFQWTTSTELNASHFIIERSADGMHFQPVTTIQAVGNSQVDQNYHADDVYPLAGRSYYRLKMVDIDGKFEYTVIRSVLLSSTPSAMLMRNPVRNSLEIVTSVSNTGIKNEWQIIGVTGQVMMKGTFSPGRIEINTSALPAGNYWIRLSTVNGALAFIKQ